MDLITGEPLALDLINTHAVTPDGVIDALESAESFRSWLDAQAHRLTLPGGELSKADLTAIAELRTHVTDAIEAAREGHRPSARSLDAINAAARSAPQYSELTSHLLKRANRDGTERAKLMAQFAEAAIELLSAPEIRKVKVCEGPLCRMLFLPAHPRRRWCSPALCGNRVRVARYYQRHRTS